MGIGASSLGGAADDAAQDVGRATLDARSADNEGVDAFQADVRNAQGGSSAPNTRASVATVPEEPGDTAQPAAVAGSSSTGNRTSDFTREIQQAYRQAGVELPGRSRTGSARPVTQPDGDRSLAQTGTTTQTADGTRPRTVPEQQIANYREVARDYEDEASEMQNGRNVHSTINARRHDLTTALDEMESSLDRNGNVQPEAQQTFNAARDRVTTSASSMMNTRAAEEATRIGDRSNRRTGALIAVGSVASLGIAAGTGLIAWNNVRQSVDHTPSGTTNNETNSGTNNITNGTSNNTNGTSNITGGSGAATTNEANNGNSTITNGTSNTSSGTAT